MLPILMIVLLGAVTGALVIVNRSRERDRLARRRRRRTRNRAHAKSWDLIYRPRAKRIGQHPRAEVQEHDTTA